MMRRLLLGCMLALAPAVAAAQTDTPNFTSKLANTGSLYLTTINELAQAQGAGADNFRANPEVQKLTGLAQTYFNAGTQTRPESELNVYMQSTRAAGGTKLKTMIVG